MLQFNAERHEYRFGSEIVPGITQILTEEGIIDPSFYTPDGRDLGTIKHLITHEHDTGTLLEDELAPEYLGYLKAYKTFLQDTGFQVLASEIPRYHKIYRYAGTPDKIGTMGKYFMVLEIKGQSKEPWHSLQTAGQAEFVKQDYNTIYVKRGSLRLFADGKYKFDPHENRQDSGIWTSLVAVYWWKKINLRRG